MPTLVSQLKCLHCGHKWYPRQPYKPVQCPSCRSPQWEGDAKEEKEGTAKEEAKL